MRIIFSKLPNLPPAEHLRYLPRQIALGKKINIYSRTPVTQTLKGDKKLFELAGVRVIRVDRKFDFSCK